MRLSAKQRTVLECIAASEANGVPLYVEHMPREVQFTWFYDTERERWLENMARRGLITIRNKCFLSTTETGRAAITRATFSDDDSSACPLCGEDGGTKCGAANCAY